MTITASSLKRKDYIHMREDIFQVQSTEFYHPGKGRTTVRCKLRSITSGKAIEHVFTSNDSVETADVSSVPAQYLYAQGDDMVFMDENTYEQYEVPRSLIEDIADFLKENQSMYVLLHDGKAIGVIAPKRVVLTVSEADDAVKGDTATNAKKTITLETGGTILAPLFIKKGEKIAVNPETREYLGREN